MIYWGLFFLGIIIMVKSVEKNDGAFEFGVFLFIVSLLLIFFTLISVINIPMKLQSQYISLSEQQKFIQKLPDPPINEIPLATSNFELAESIVNQKLNFWDKVRKYNQSIIFWNTYPHLDLIVWGYPRIYPRIEKLPVINGGN